MAHLRSIERRCQACSKAAVVELFGDRNQSYGPYCRTHGERRLKELIAEEKAIAGEHK